MGRRKIDREEIDHELADIAAALDNGRLEHGGGAYQDDDPIELQELSSARRVPGTFHDGSWG